MTKEQRLSFYKELLKVVCEDPDTGFGFCWYISNQMDYWYRPNKIKPICTYSNSVFRKRLPELWKYKPSEINEWGYWFPCTPKGWETRISILEKVIKNLKKDIAATRRKTAN